MYSATLFCRELILLTCFLSVTGLYKRIDETNLKMIIDHDGAADDAMAIFMAILHEKYMDGPKVIAITITHGNVEEPQAFNNTLRILDVTGRQDIPIYRGSKKPLLKTSLPDHYFGIDGLGDNDYNLVSSDVKAQPMHASNALLELSKEHEGQLIVVAIGALTNIAVAMNMDPLFLERLDQLYLGAGNIGTRPEFNALADVEAYHAIIQNSNPDKVTVIPFSQSPDISREWRLQVFGKLQSKFVKAMNAFEMVSLKNDEWARLDPFVMAVAVNKTLIKETRYSKNNVVLCGEGRGINTNIFTKNKNEANVEIIMSVIKNSYKNFLIYLFS